ncbi:MAG: GrpB family protein [Bacteroidota bacterium]
MEKLILTHYQSSWAADFNAIESALFPALLGENTYLEHVGSTAVPGMMAKPIIDIDLVFQYPAEFGEIKKALHSLGYRHRGDQGIPSREVFKRTPGQAHPILDCIHHHLYVCQADSRELHRHLLFRDHLRQNPEARHTYIQLKCQLALQAEGLRRKYAALKEQKARNFIEECLAKATE